MKGAVSILHVTKYSDDTGIQHLTFPEPASPIDFDPSGACKSDGKTSEFYQTAPDITAENV